MYILGISALYHDSAAVLIKDGKIIAAVQEERFTRIKHDHRFPLHAIDYCLRYAGISITDVSYVAYYEQSGLKFDRIIKTHLSYVPFGISSFITAIPLWIKQKMWMNAYIRKNTHFHKEVITPTHHESHAASAFFPSPFKKAAIITMDGVGEWTTTSFGIGDDSRITMLSEIRFPHSLGMLYSAFTYYTGFKVNSGEYKLMGLAPYGTPKYVNVIYNNLIDTKNDGSFRLNMDYFNYPVGFTMTNQKFHALFGRKPRTPEASITQLDMDLAASVQKVIEDIVLKISYHVHNHTGQKNLCLAGGVALNCVSNARIITEGPFDNVWIQPASGDAGGALGAALFTWYQHLNNDRLVSKNDSQKGSYLGSLYSDSDIQSYLDSQEIPYRELSEKDLIQKTAALIANGNIVGWFQGRMEYGPRALGNRSILGDARNRSMQSVMNQKIKYRESFRPFAPAILAEKAGEWFTLTNRKGNKITSPYMLITAQVAKKKQKHTTKQLQGLDKLRVIRSSIPAVTHVDYSARIQTVHKETNNKFHALLTAFYKKTHCPVLINTSFNVRGEPIVESPKDAYQCFMRTEMDYLVLGNYLLDKSKQSMLQMRKNWKKEFDLD